MMNVRASFYDQGEGSGTRLGICDKGRNAQERDLQCIFFFCIEASF